jgi:hypothetical protein
MYHTKVTADVVKSFAYVLFFDTGERNVNIDKPTQYNLELATVYYQVYENLLIS